MAGFPSDLSRIQVISGFQGIFAVTTMLFEMPAHWVAMVPGVTHYQDTGQGGVKWWMSGRMEPQLSYQTWGVFRIGMWSYLHLYKSIVTI